MGARQNSRSIRSIHGLENLPEDAAGLIHWAEARGEPLLFPGLLLGWPAVASWKCPAGFARLRELAGDAEVQVMMSTSRIFHGDISRHQPALLGFGVLLEMLESMPPPSSPQMPAPSPAPGEAAAAVVHTTWPGGPDVEKQAGAGRRTGSSCLGNDSSNSGSRSRSGVSDSDKTRNSAANGTIECDSSSSSSTSCAHSALPGSADQLHVYLAQQPLTGGLAPLQVDTPRPACLYGKEVESINLWMCGGSVRSSLHYDLHHNLLVLVSGRKVVTVVPPYLTHCVYPMTLTGDASNHSQVPFADPQPAARHPAYLAAMAAAAVAELRAGDALFLPEGWWHQVDSGPETTIAINYWWRSAQTELLTAAVTPPPPPALLLPPQYDNLAAEAGVEIPAAEAVTPGTRDTPRTLKAAVVLNDASMAASSSPSSNPGPGLRNLFTLRQLTRAAIEDIVESLLGTMAPPPPSPHAAVAPSGGTSGAAAIHVLHPNAVQVLSDAIQAGSTVSAASAAGRAPRPLAPYVVGLLLLLRPGEAASLGLTGCPVAAALAALTPRQVAAALYEMCRRTPALVSELLTRCCRVPAVACLLTRAFDQAGTAAVYAAGGAAPPDGPVGSSAAASEGAGAGLQDASGHDASGHDVDEHIAHEQMCKRRRRNGDQGSGVCTAFFETLPPELNKDYGTGNAGCGGGGGGDGCGVGNSGKAGGGGAEDAAARALSDDRECGDGGDRSGSGHDGGTLASDFFDQLYGTVDDPDVVFRLLLEGRSALTSTARRILIDSVLG
ncbi:hypothetical protein VaNZ11_008657 [Volvox africanus]|uniref:JmjC domain-containing protein n=1 Tax=Volvox africanus TaxID=51714 RepID=A0ABQ5S6K1_9CHLO|nr:hypothetical protein VaNZ11_008657 [Volvox africanus]